MTTSASSAGTRRAAIAGQSAGGGAVMTLVDYASSTGAFRSSGVNFGSAV